MKVALLIPYYGDPKARFVACLNDLMIRSMAARFDYQGAPEPIELEAFMISSSKLPESRTRLLGSAMDWGAHFSLWLDADQVFPADALLRLLAHRKPVVAANYARRGWPTAPATLKRGADGKLDFVRTTREKAEAGELEQVEAPGLGLCLCDMRLFNDLHAHALKEGRKHFWPLFLSAPIDEMGRVFEGEDNYFFRRLAEAGIPVFVDHGLSWEVGHVHEMVLTNEQASAQPLDYLAYSSGRRE